MAEDDWRLTGQDRYLKGISLTHKPYRVYSEKWEHDHCAFCGAKFIDPSFSDAHRKLADDPAVQIAGYTTTADYRRGAEYEWICESCFADFVEEFEWKVTTSDG